MIVMIGTKRDNKNVAIQYLHSTIQKPKPGVTELDNILSFGEFGGLHAFMLGAFQGEIEKIYNFKNQKTRF